MLTVYLVAFIAVVAGISAGSLTGKISAIFDSNMNSPKLDEAVLDHAFLPACAHHVTSKNLVWAAWYVARIPIFVPTFSPSCRLPFLIVECGCRALPTRYK